MPWLYSCESTTSFGSNCVRLFKAFQTIQFLFLFDKTPAKAKSLIQLCLNDCIQSIRIELLQCPTLIIC